MFMQLDNIYIEFIGGAMSVESNLSFTQRIRKSFVEELMVDGKIRGDVVNDPKMGKTFLAALKDMDSQEISLKRLEQEEDSAGKDRDLLLQQNKILEDLQRTTGNIFERTAGNARAAIDGVVDHAALPAIDLVEGQMDKGHSTLMYDEFMAAQREAAKDSDEE